MMHPFSNCLQREAQDYRGWDAVRPAVSTGIGAKESPRLE
jgi:hypothetical protein